MERNSIRGFVFLFAGVLSLSILGGGLIHASTPEEGYSELILTDEDSHIQASYHELLMEASGQEESDFLPNADWSDLGIFGSQVVDRIDREMLTESVEFKTVIRGMDDLCYDHQVVVREGQSGIRELELEKKYRNGKLLETRVVRNEVVVEPVDRVIQQGNLDYPGPVSEQARYTIDDLEYLGMIDWEGMTFSYYSEQVLPGEQLFIPGRHISGGFVRDKDGYIVLASDYYDKGTIISTPFGAEGKVYDAFGTGQPAYRFDVYTR